ATLLALMGANDEDDPWITGAASENRRGERDLSRRTFPSQSIRIGNTWYSYARVEPFATGLSMAVDLSNALRSGSPTKAIRGMFDSVVGQMKSKTFLSGVGDLLTALESEDSADKIARWSASFAVSWVPNLVRSTGRSFQESYPDRAV